ncbi:DUF55-domain-containing protein [Westerdykella ornata]|uniref:Thymocyte nuclear protein 1 n=1 Tax=Westerdykella ornata TaxID=318751 RepID=A0A6A6JDK8_WESOR|nr:DUF55-domain-containing protein [Westerdykella ornata]KAF2274512.1 DUF55-domain-containing protein [Westerdykella ornata]
MAVTRRSTRTSTAQAANYAELSSETDGRKPLGRQGTRSKRARDEQGGIEVEKPPRKKAAQITSARPASPKPRKTATIPTPVSGTNRDAEGNQEIYWLLKAEPLPRYENGVNVAFSIDDLQACKDPEPWTGVRNPQARNNMQAMRKGDLGFFYHSNAKPSGVAGILRVVKEAEVDETAFDPKDPYYDPKSDKEKPKWYCVSVEFVQKFDEVVDLHTIKSYAGKGQPLEGMQLVTNSRLSVSRVTKDEWKFILDLAAGKNQEKSATNGA